jgi:hypothetical protein
MGTWECSICGKKWESDGDCEQIDGEPVCSDCYYKGLGELIEEHPIGFPHAPHVPILAPAPDETISTMKIDANPNLSKELDGIFMGKGESFFWGNGDRSAAKAFDLCSCLHDAINGMSGLQQIGLQGENVTSEMDADNETDKIDETACKIFEALTGIRIRFLRKHPRWRSKP